MRHEDEESERHDRWRVAVDRGRTNRPPLGTKGASFLDGRILPINTYFGVADEGMTLEEGRILDLQPNSHAAFRFGSKPSDTFVLGIWEFGDVAEWLPYAPRPYVPPTCDLYKRLAKVGRAPTLPFTVSMTTDEAEIEA